jgi:hypothetical protein
MRTKKGIISVAALVSALLPPLMLHAQGTLYISDLGQTPVASLAVGSDSWIAETISTGSNPGGYVLNSVSVLMNPATGTAGGFSISIYNKTGDPNALTPSSDVPQASLGSLDGANPSTGGIISYTTPGILLSPSTFYFVVETAATPVAEGAFNWSSLSPGSAPVTGAEGWGINDVYYTSTNGSSWQSVIRQDVFQLGINATAAPEPSTCALAGLALASGCFWRRIRGK